LWNRFPIKQNTAIYLGFEARPLVDATKASTDGVNVIMEIAPIA
jgi:hypothetical protein